MPHIHTEAGQHDLTASACIFRVDGPGPRVLLHNHRLLHRWLQFGGHVELHEHPWAALVHEVREESGYDMKQLKLLQPPGPRLTDLDDSKALAHPLPFSFLTHQFGDDEGHFHTDASYAFLTDEAPKHKIADGESTEMRLFTRKEVAALSESTMFNDVRTKLLFAFDHIVGKWEAVDPGMYHA